MSPIKMKEIKQLQLKLTKSLHRIDDVLQKWGDMMKPVIDGFETSLFNGVMYYMADEIMKRAPIYSKGCRSTREMVKKRNIEEPNYLFAKRSRTGEWVKSDGSSRQLDKVFVSESIIKSIPEIYQAKDVPPKKVVDSKGIEEAPEILYLEDHEMFHDEEGNPLEIEVRGERVHDKIYFKVKDVSKAFDMPKLQDIVLDSRYGYEVKKDYEKFICKNPVNHGICAKGRERLFLTYEGLLRVLFVSRNGKTSKFIKWATETLFTVQMGTTEQKDKLVANIKGVSYDCVQQFFSASATTFPCIYLVSFNSVKHLRKAMKIPKEYTDDSMVFKLGLTKDFETRKNGHKQEYKELADYTDLKLVKFSYIDPRWLFEAETTLKETCADYTFKWKSKCGKIHDEIIIVPKKEMKWLFNQYNKIGEEFSGQTQQINEKMKETQNEMRVMEKEIERLEAVISGKDTKIELLEFKLQMATTKK